MFALPDRIEPYLSGVLDALPREHHLRGLPADRLADRLAYYLGEINAAHPFREGNGRAQRAFIRPARRRARVSPRVGPAVA